MSCYRRRQQVVVDANSTCSISCGFVVYNKLYNKIYDESTVYNTVAGPERSLDSDEPRASNHCTKLPSITLSWQNILLHSFTARHCSTITGRTSASRGTKSPPRLLSEVLSLGLTKGHSSPCRPCDEPPSQAVDQTLHEWSWACSKTSVAATSTTRLSSRVTNSSSHHSSPLHIFAVNRRASRLPDPRQTGCQSTSDACALDGGGGCEAVNEAMCDSDRAGEMRMSK